MRTYEKLFHQAYKDHKYFHLTVESSGGEVVEGFSEYFVDLKEACKAARKVSKENVDKNVYVTAKDQKTLSSAGCVVYSNGKFEWMVL